MLIFFAYFWANAMQKRMAIDHNTFTPKLVEEVQPL